MCKSFQGIGYRYFGYAVKDMITNEEVDKKVVKCIIISEFVEEANI